jgi:SMC interacting uncharacterized protein involved in chromosome segregation
MKGGVQTGTEGLKQLLSKCETDEERLGVLKSQVLGLETRLRKEKAAAEELVEKVKCLQTEVRAKEEENASLAFNYERLKKRLNVLQEEARSRECLTGREG